MGRLRVVTALAVVVLAACTSGTLQTERSEERRAPDARPASTVGIVSAPRRPIIVDPLPAGWRVQDVRVDDLSTVGPAHTLYMRPGATPDSGPAIAVGHVNDDGGYALCSSAPANIEVNRIGDRAMVWTGGPNYDSNGFVLGRDVTDKQILAVGYDTRVVNEGQITVSLDALPQGFEKVVGVWMPPNNLLGEIITLVNEDRYAVRIGAYDPNPPARLLSRFWDATVADQRCADDASTQVNRWLGETHVTIESDAPAADVRMISRRLRRTDAAGFEAFRSTVQPEPGPR
jgi:hypothetical protein